MPGTPVPNLRQAGSCEDPTRGKKLWAYLRGDKLNGVVFRSTRHWDFIPILSQSENCLLSWTGQHLEQADMILSKQVFPVTGYKMVRFWNNQVEKDIAGVVRDKLRWESKISFGGYNLSKDRRLTMTRTFTAVIHKGMLVCGCRSRDGQSGKTVEEAVANLKNN